jgi:RNA polymerase sigma-70 factor (ECF subfamily)
MSRNNRKAFEHAVRSYAGRLYALAVMYVQDGAEAEDVVQSAFLKAWEHWDELEDDPKAPAWLYTVVRNEAIERLRLRRTSRNHEGRVAAHRAAMAPEPPEDGWDREDEQQHRLARVRRVVSGMHEPYRSVLLLRFAQKLSYAEIAETLEQPLGTVKTHLCRAVRLVRRACVERGEEVEDHDGLR